ncbi:hypothetical protein C8K36_101230 [Rhodococcus sp. OK519]|uniref:WXG100-like domain-containing protein n=1 Tax=Rhodococcus sp. OK519 TaxID=2135729 RepID=UPI000D33BCCE|nr:hypothetical protein C8K36_101230 [Rhodococcus sp. OK519]
MGIEIPGPLRTVASLASGQDWPEADETSLRRLSDAWEAAAGDVERIGAGGDAAMQAALAGVAGAVNEAMSAHWATIGGNDGAVDQIVAVCRELADACEFTAADVEEAKLAIIAALVALAAQIAALAASAVATFGASTAAIPAAQLATQFTIRTIITQLLQRVAREVAVGVVREVAIAGGIQVYQLAQGERDSLDFGALGKDAIGAAAEGVVTGLLGRTGAGGVVLDGIESAGRRTAAGVAVDLTTGGVGAAAGDVVKGEDVSAESVLKGAIFEASDALRGGGGRPEPAATPPSSLNMN